MPQDLNSALEYSKRWLDIIKSPADPSEDTAKQIIEES